MSGQMGGQMGASPGFQFGSAGLGSEALTFGGTPTFGGSGIPTFGGGGTPTFASAGGTRSFGAMPAAPVSSSAAGGFSLGAAPQRSVRKFKRPSGRGAR